MQSLELETIQTEVVDRVAWLTLNRPDALNAWTPQLGSELTVALDRAVESDDVRAIVLTGAGRAFSSGADLKATSAGVTPTGRPDVLSLLRDVYNPLILRVRTIPKPVVAAVNGVAAGIGCSLALAADLVVGVGCRLLSARVRQHRARPRRRRVRVPGARIGHARASEMALLADRIPAVQALDWGLVNRVVAPMSWAAAARELAGRLAAGPPGSYAAIKRPSTPRHTPVSPNCWSLRPSSNRSGSSPPTSPRASPPSWKSARPRSPEGRLRR